MQSWIAFQILALRQTSSLEHHVKSLSCTKSVLNVAGGFWDKTNKRKFLEHYAQANKFDPLVPENWYSITAALVSATVRIFTGLKLILCRTKGHHFWHIIREIWCLLCWICFLKLTSTQLTSSTDCQVCILSIVILSNFIAAQYWDDPRNRRKYFEDFAAEHNFDPLTVSNWYSVKGIAQEVSLHYLAATNFNRRKKYSNTTEGATSML